MNREQCLALEQQGQLDVAYKAYLQHGHVDDAARMLIGHGRASDAADLLLSQVAKLPQPLDATARQRAVRAARLFEDHGKPARALEVLAWLRDADELGQTAVRIAELGLHHEAGVAVARYGDPKKAPSLLMRTAKSDPRHAAACVELIRALVRGAPLSMQVDRWFADFIRKGPGSDEEADAFYALAALYVKQKLPENAAEVLGRLIEKKPTYKDAVAQKKKLEAAMLGSSDDLAKVLNEDAAFEAAEKAWDKAKRPQTSDMALSAIPIEGPSLAAVAAVAVAAANAAAAAAIADEPEAMQTLSFAPGVTVSKRYKIIDVVGKGGMSIVYKAHDIELNETVALKLFTQPTNEEAIERFKQEIKLARQLIHENIIRVYDLGTTLGARYLTMELLEGEDLHAKMTRGISLRDGCNLLAQACAGLEVAHQLGVVHRDIKPENLFVTSPPSENAIVHNIANAVVKVMDFGIAKSSKQQGLTLAGMVVGTPEYMAPEQAHGHMQVTHAADLYSIGIILYALATGQLPFRHAELVPLLMLHVQQPPEPPRKKNPGCPVEVERLVLELLAKRAEDRPKSAKEVEHRLRDLRARGVV